MEYAELSYFEGYHFQHIARWQEHLRESRLTALARRAMRGVPFRALSCRLRGVGAT